MNFGRGMAMGTGRLRAYKMIDSGRGYVEAKR